MGRAWFETSADAARTFGAADEVLGDSLGARLSTLCFEGPAEILNRTDVAQPALFVVGVASFQAMFAGVERPRLAASAGLSLGEYTALHIAGAIGFREALEVVALRGHAMQEAAAASDSGMVALIGADAQQAESVCVQAGQGEVLVPANFNAPGQVVLSGEMGAIDRAVTAAEGLGLKASKLAVAGAFHSPIMAPAAERLGEALSAVEISEPICPVLSNVTGEPHDGSDADSIREGLIRQLTAPVQWVRCCEHLLGLGSGRFHELAPGRVLSGLMRRIDRPTKVVCHDEPSVA